MLNRENGEDRGSSSDDNRELEKEMERVMNDDDEIEMEIDGVWRREMNGVGSNTDTCKGCEQTGGEGDL